MSREILIQIRRAVRDRRYRFSDHALDEADADNLNEDDVLGVLLSGDLVSIYSDDERGMRYVVLGDVHDVEVEVVCRFDSDGILLIIITVYAVDER